jgi:uncharacterized protein
MQINQDYNTAAYTFRSYKDGEVVIFDPLGEGAIVSPDTAAAVASTRTLNKSILMLPNHLTENWEPGNLDELTSEHLEVLLDFKPELLLLGTGEKIRFPKPSITQILISKGIGVEVMDNGAACRTYNFLTSDERRVAVALLID